MALRPLPQIKTLKQTYAPRRYWGKTLDDFEWAKDVREAVEDFISALPEAMETGQGLMLVGPPGSGKTCLATIILQAAFEMEPNQKTPCFYTSFPAYLKRLQDQMGRERLVGRVQGENGDLLFEQWKSTDDLLYNIRNRMKLLVLDDIGKEHSTNTRWAEDEFDFLIRYRYDLGLPTVLTSNVPVQAWGFRYSEPMESFLHECCPTVLVGGRDWRASDVGQGPARAPRGSSREPAG